MTTVNLERWRGHVAAARRQGIALGHYAKEHGISRYTLYAAQQQLRQAGELTTPVTARRKRSSPPPFVAVQVAASRSSALRARLPNGVQLEFEQLESSACAALVAMLAALPCSG